MFMKKAPPITSGCKVNANGVLARKQQGGDFKYVCGFIAVLWPHRIKIAQRSGVVPPSSSSYNSLGIPTYYYLQFLFLTPDSVLLTGQLINIHMIIF